MINDLYFKCYNNNHAFKGFVCLQLFIWDSKTGLIAFHVGIKLHFLNFCFENKGTYEFLFYAFPKLIVPTV